MSATSDELVEDVRALARLPDAGDPDAAGILRFADAELVTLLAALMKSAQKEHWMVPEDTVGNSSTVLFPLPRRALDRAYRKVTLVNSSGLEIECYEVAPGNPDGFQDITRYYVQADALVFTKAFDATYTLRVRCRRRPSRLVPVSEGAAIAKALTTTTLSISSATNAWMTSIGPAFGPGPFPTLYVDIVRGDAPYDHSYVDLQAASYSAAVLTLSSAIALSAFVDLTAIMNARQDYVCLRDQTVYPPLPEAAFPALVAGTASRVLQSLGDVPGAAAARGTYGERLAEAMQLISPRNDEGGRAIVSRNSGLRAGYGGGGYGRRVRW